MITLLLLVSVIALLLLVNYQEIDYNRPDLCQIWSENHIYQEVSKKLDISRAGERLWAIGDVNGIWPLTHVGEYEGDVVAANILGDARPANYEAVPRVTYTDPQAAAVGAVEAEYSATAPVSQVPKTATYTHAYAESNGFLTLLSDGERLTGAYALGPEAGEWMQQATLAIRAHVPLEVLSDTIQPFPSFSGVYDAALKALRMEIADMPRPVRPMDAQMASLSG